MYQKSFFILAVLISGVLLIAPVPQGVEPVAFRAGAVIVLVIGLWSTAVVPSFYGSLIFMFAAIVLQTAPPNIVFSGFHAAATWLVLGGLILGLGVKRSGLDVRLVRAFLGHFPKSYTAMIYGIFWVSAALSFIVPSAAGRVALLVPIMLSLADELGFSDEAPGRSGLVLAATMGTMIPAFAILPANVPNMALYGAVESIYGLQLTYGEFFILNYPVMGVGALLFYPAIIAFLLRDRPSHPEHHEAAKPWGQDEKRLLIILLLALALWVTDTLHGVSPAWVALGAGILCLLPRIGPISIGIMPPKSLADDVNYGPIIFVAGVIGLGAVANHTGLGSLIAEQLMDFIAIKKSDSLGGDFVNFASISFISIIIGLFTTMPAQPSIMAPMAQALADASGWSLMSVLMTSMTAWMIMPLFYQAPPIVIAVALGKLRIATVNKMLTSYMIFSILFVLPVHFFWGRTLGMFTGGN